MQQCFADVGACELTKATNVLLQCVTDCGSLVWRPSSHPHSWCTCRKLPYRLGSRYTCVWFQAAGHGAQEQLRELSVARKGHQRHEPQDSNHSVISRRRHLPTQSGNFVSTRSVCLTYTQWHLSHSHNVKQDY
jgi:hypothetical protein